MTDNPTEENPKPEAEEFRLPVEVEIYIDPDGSVVFADLEEQTLPIARQLDPDWQQGEGDFCLPEQEATDGESSGEDSR